MAVNWFQVDSNSPNDPKIKAIIRQGGQAWAGSTWLLWCYIASHGRSEVGLGVRADGSQLDLDELASECLFASVEEARVFLDFAAQVKLIHPQLWADKGIVFLPAMWTRWVTYVRSKGRNGSHYVDSKTLAAAILSGAVVAPETPQRPGRATAGTGGPSRAVKSLQTNKQTNRHTEEKISGSAKSAERLPGIDAKEHAVKEILTYHDQLFTEATSQAYPGYTAGDAANVKHMLKKTPKEDLKAELLQMFRSTDPFIQQCGYTIGAFLKLRAKLIVAKTSPANRGDPGAKGRTQVEPGKYAGA